MDCPECEGQDKECRDCEGRGSFDIVGCPKEMITSETQRIIEYAELFYKGLPPVAGGTLDQTYWFLTAARYVRYVEGFVKAKKGIIDGQT